MTITEAEDRARALARTAGSQAGTARSSIQLMTQQAAPGQNARSTRSKDARRDTLTRIHLRKLLVEARGIHKVAGVSRSQTALHTQWLCDSLDRDHWVVLDAEPAGASGHRVMHGGQIQTVLAVTG